MEAVEVWNLIHLVFRFILLLCEHSLHNCAPLFILSFLARFRFGWTKFLAYYDQDGWQESVYILEYIILSLFCWVRVSANINLSCWPTLLRILNVVNHYVFFRIAVRFACSYTRIWCHTRKYRNGVSPCLQWLHYLCTKWDKIRCSSFGIVAVEEVFELRCYKET